MAPLKFQGVYFPTLNVYYGDIKILARKVSSHPMDGHFQKKYKKNSLISCSFMGKHAFWMASFQCLAKSLVGINKDKPSCDRFGRHGK